MRRVGSTLAGAVAVAAVVIACSDASVAPPDDEIAELPDRTAPPGDGGDAEACGGADLARDPANCGACGNACLRGTNQEAACVSGKCVTFCNPGFDDCDGDVSNGCERPVASDPDNCGACGRACATCGGPSAACTDGSCGAATLATAQTGAHGITTDATHVYWTNRVVTTGSIRRAPKGGFAATAPENVLTDVTFPTDVVVASPYAYYTLSGQNGVGRAGLPGIYGPFPPFVTGQDFPGGMAADATGIYWTKNVSFVGSLMRCFNCGASAAEVATSLPSAGILALDATSIVLVSSDSIVKVDKTGQNKATLAISQTDVAGLASDGATVFVARSGGPSGGGGIASVPKTGGDVTPLLTSITPESLLLDGERLYYTTSAPDKAVWRTDKTGKRTVRLARGLAAPGRTTTDDACVYFVDGAAIRKVTK
jgi:hypothetical protein